MAPFSIRNSGASNKTRALQEALRLFLAPEEIKTPAVLKTEPAGVLVAVTVGFEPEFDMRPHAGSHENRPIYGHIAYVSISWIKSILKHLCPNLVRGGSNSSRMRLDPSRLRTIALTRRVRCKIEPPPVL